MLEKMFTRKNYKMKCLINAVFFIICFDFVFNPHSHPSVYLLIETDYTDDFEWWWSSGQCAHLLLRWSEFESRWILGFIQLNA